MLFRWPSISGRCVGTCSPRPLSQRRRCTRSPRCSAMVSGSNLYHSYTQESMGRRKPNINSGPDQDPNPELLRAGRIRIQTRIRLFLLRKTELFTHFTIKIGQILRLEHAYVLRKLSCSFNNYICNFSTCSSFRVWFVFGSGMNWSDPNPQHMNKKKLIAEMRSREVLPDLVFSWYLVVCIRMESFSRKYTI